MLLHAVAYMCKASYVPWQGCELIDWNILQWYKKIWSRSILILERDMAACMQYAFHMIETREKNKHHF